MVEGNQRNIPRVRESHAFVALFGRFRLWTSDGSEVVISNRRARALLAMLSLAKGEAIDRDFLSKLLWPGRFEAHAKASLRQCLLDLGKLLLPCGTEIIVVSRGSVALRPDSLSTDLDTLEDALAGKKYASVMAQLSVIGTEPILDQMDFGDAFNQWRARYSANAEIRLHAAVETAVVAMERKGDENGRTQLHSVWSARHPGVPEVAAYVAREGKARIAVLPFQSVGTREGQGYFADGIVDELITALGQMPQLLVAGRTSSFHFRDSALALPKIADALRVSHLLEGSVQRQGERVRIQVHLIDGASGFEIWGQRYDGTLDDVFALQENVAQAITAAIGSALGIAMQTPKIQGMTQSKPMISSSKGVRCGHVTVLCR